jgi:hypothetical protein
MIVKYRPAAEGLRIDEPAIMIARRCFSLP